jgi:hypothetical protein
MKMYPAFYFKDTPKLQHAYQFISSMPPGDTHFIYFLKKRGDIATTHTTVYDILLWGDGQQGDHFSYESIEVFGNKEYSSWKILF